MTLAEFKALIREQFLMLLIDREAALRAIPHMLPDDEEVRGKGLSALHEVLIARGELSGEAEERWRRITGLFRIEANPGADKSNGGARLAGAS